MSHPAAGLIFRPSRPGREGRLFLALAMALMVHSALFLLPFPEQAVLPVKASELLKIRLLARPEADDYLPQSPSENQAPTTVEPPQPDLIGPARSAPPQTEPVREDAVDTERVKRSILASQFLPLEQKGPAQFSLHSPEILTEPRLDFSVPHRANMYEVMMPPLPELPFAHQPGFVQFSYTAPGFLGDLQYFFEVITPEFEFKTKNGTRVKCALILVLAACAWD